MAKPRTMNDIKLNLVVLKSADISLATKFYRCLGLHFEKHRHGNGPEHYSAELPGGVFELYPLDGPVNSSRGTRIGFSVPDVDAAVEALVGYTGAVVSTPCESDWGRRAVVVDPDGHKVELLQS